MDILHYSLGSDCIVLCGQIYIIGVVEQSIHTKSQSYYTCSVNWITHSPNFNPVNSELHRWWRIPFASHQASILSYSILTLMVNSRCVSRMRMRRMRDVYIPMMIYLVFIYHLNTASLVSSAISMHML